MLKKIFRFDSNEIIFDALLYVYASYVLYGLIAEQSLLSLFSPFIAMGLPGVVNFFLLWYMGIVFNRYQKNTKNYLVLISVALFFFYMLGCLHLTLTFTLGETEVFGKKNDSFFHIAGTAVWGFIWFILGLVIGIQEFYKSKQPNAVNQYRKFVKILMMIGVGILSIRVAFEVVDEFHVRGGWLMFATWLTILAVLLLVTNFLVNYSFQQWRTWLSFLEKYRIREGAKVVFKGYIMPFIIVLVLCLWHEIYVKAKVVNAINSKEMISSFSMIIYLLFTGLLPMRIVLLFEPPINIIGFITGGISLYYFIAQSLKLAASVGIA